MKKISDIYFSVRNFLFRFDCPYCKSKIKLREGSCPFCKTSITSWDLEMMLSGKIHDDQIT